MRPGGDRKDRPSGAPGAARQGEAVRSVTRVLEWLEGFPGDTWEQRWLSSGADSAPRGWVLAAAADGDPPTRQKEITNGAFGLIHARVIRPSYAWLLINKHGQLDRFLEINDPRMLTRLRELPAYDRAFLRNRRDAEHCLARVMIRTGKNMSELRGDELLHYADVVRTSGRPRREHLAWELLVDLGVFGGEPATLRAAWSAKGNTRQHSVATLVDRYGIPPSGVRDVLVEYLSEVKPGMDYSSLSGLAYRLVRLFWWEVLQINPEQQDLRLSPQVATEWRERLGRDHPTVRSAGKPTPSCSGSGRSTGIWPSGPMTTRSGGESGWPRARSHAHSPVRRQSETPAKVDDAGQDPGDGAAAPCFIAGAQERRDWGRRLLAAATATAPGEEFTVDGVRFARCESTIRYDCQRPSQLWADVLEVTRRCQTRSAATAQGEHHQTGRGRVLGLGGRRMPAPHRHPHRGTPRTHPVVAAASHPGRARTRWCRCCTSCRPRPTPNG